MTVLEAATVLDWARTKILALGSGPLAPVNSQLYQNEAPQLPTVTYPFLLCSAASPGTIRGVGGVKVITPVILTVQAVGLPGSYAAMEGVMAAIDGVLDNAPTVFYGSALIDSCLRDNQLSYLDDDRYQHVVTTYRVEVTIP